MKENTSDKISKEKKTECTKKTKCKYVKSNFFDEENQTSFIVLRLYFCDGWKKHSGYGVCNGRGKEYAGECHSG